MSRPRLAPSDALTAISLSRAVARASSRLPTLMQAITSSRNTAASRAYSVFLKSPTTKSRSVRATSLNCCGYSSPGFACARRCIIASRSLAAACKVTPFLRRASAQITVGSFTGKEVPSPPGFSLSGSHTLASYPLKRWVMMPTRVRGLPFRKNIVPRILGSPPNCVCHNR